MRTIEKIIELIEKEDISNAAFERKNELGNGYLKKVHDGEADITHKMLERIRKNSNPFYQKLFANRNIEDHLTNTETSEGDDNTYHVRVIDEVGQLTDKNVTMQALARSIELSAEARLVDAESRKIEARNVERLIALLEMKIGEPNIEEKRLKANAVSG